ncbi:MAG: phosphate signaling complex protein PhoU [Bdellovibrionales bacterium]|nr:phosphate signaling complex protein PhoU [Bdellovibrionales bacterium]
MIKNKAPTNVIQANFGSEFKPMSRSHLDREIEKLKQMILALSALVEESVHRAVRSVRDNDVELARMVIDGDSEIDSAEVDVEEECLKALALYQPVTIDLRFIVAVLKMNNDLERIGDLSANIAGRALSLAKHPPLEPPFDLESMSEKTQKMLRDALQSLVTMDSNLANSVRTADSAVDEIHRATYKRVQEEVKRTPQHATQLITYLSVARHLERIADQATNIAEDVIYMIDGAIVRHTPEGQI